MEHRKEPGAAHQALMSELRGVVGKFDAQGMPGVERIAILAQLIGQARGDEAYARAIAREARP